MIADPPNLHGCDCWASIAPSHELAVLWKKIRGANRWPLVTPHEIRSGESTVLLGRIMDLDPAQFTVVVDWVATKRRRPSGEVRELLCDIGAVPIAREGVAVHPCPVHRHALLAALPAGATSGSLWPPPELVAPSGRGW